MNTNEVRVVPRTTRNFQLTLTDIFEFNTTYAVRVRMRINQEWQPYSAACNITTPAIPTSQVVSGQCGSTLPLLQASISCNAVINANLYEFRIENLTNTAEPVQIIQRTTTNITLNLMSVLPRYSTTYSIQVRVRSVINGVQVFSNFGPACTVTTPLFPTSEIQLSQCDTTIPSNTTTILANNFAGATAFRFRFENAALGYVQEIVRPSRGFLLNMFTGLLPATTYDVSVSLQIGGVFGPYGKVCELTTPGIARNTSLEELVEVTEFSVVAYPNPFAESFGIDIKTLTTDNVNVSIYDMTGRLLEVREVKLSDIENTKLGDRYPSGVYNVIVNQGSET
ncbi:T9SS type A sorting domain-containing protein, partial [Microcystis aeruginosa]|uniref:T9SS type A sorting domain-containing protein n=1 Tax=Microcystis aeruginosa TaxID=1126 RepID=UPI00147D9E68